MRSHATLDWKSQFYSGLAFQYRKRYEVTCDPQDIPDTEGKTA